MKVLLALGAFFKFRWLLNLIPGVGPFLAVAAEAVVATVKYICKGLLGIVTNPANLAAAITLAMVMTIVGIKLGVKLDAHLVREAKLETQEWKSAHTKLVDDAKTVDAKSKSKHKLALKAKAEAEVNEKAKIEAEKKSTPAVVGTPAGVQQPVAKRKAPSGPNYIGGPSLQWFGTIFGPVKTKS